MGKLDFSIPDDFLKQLGNMQDVERIAPKMIDAALPIIEKRLKREISPHNDTGDLLKSLKKTKAKRTKTEAYFGSVHPSGLDSKGVRNMEKLIYLAYGTQKMAPKLSMEKVAKDTEAEVLKKMEEVFNQEVEK